MAGQVSDKLRNLDQDASWCRVYDYSLHLTCNRSGFPKLAQFETAYISESQVLEEKKQALFALDPFVITGDNAYFKATHVRSWATAGVILLTPAVKWQNGFWDPDDPWVKAGKDPMLAPSARIWGYNMNFGSFGQFCIAQDHAVLPKAEHLTWEEAAAPTLVGTTAYRMLFGWKGNDVKEGDVILVWGGSGGLGTQGIQLANVHGTRAVAVVSDHERGEYCKKLGAVGYINCKNFDHWGIPPHWTDGAGQKEWTAGCRAFGKVIWEVLGEKRNPDIVFEHPGEADDSYQHLCLRSGWYGCDLCRYDRLFRFGRLTLSLGTPEAAAGFAWF